MVFKGYVTQDVPLGNGIILNMRSIATTHGRWIEWAISQDTEDTSIQYTRHTFSLMQLAASLDAINGKPTGPAISRLLEQNQRDEFIVALNKRMDFIGRLPEQMSNDFIVQNVWFNGRIRKAMAGPLMDTLGNS